jgi:propionyl-CoA synthetase
VIFQREQEVAQADPGRDFDWHAFQYGVDPADCVRSRATTPPISSIPRAPPASPRAWCAHRRASGGAELDDEEHLRRRSGRGVLGRLDVGWVVGHSYICYAPLIHGNTTIVFEGKPVGTPDAGTFWRVIAGAQGRSFFTAPTAFRAIKREDPRARADRDYDLSSLRTLFLAGERADPDTIVWAQEKLGVPVIDHWWQTETGWAIAANPMGVEPLPVKIGSPSVRCRAMTCRCWTRAATPCPRARWAPSRSSCPCRPAPCRRCGTPRRGSANPTSALPRLLRDRRRGLCRRGRLPLHHGAHR